MPKRDPQRRIDSKQAAAGAGSGAGIMIGGTTSHDIAGPKHYGTLADIQAPQFLKTDGTRPLIGNLSVGMGVTIDGVDLDVHAADPDAHHNRATGVNAIAVTVGQEISLNLRASNPGLSDDDGLYLGTPAAVSASTTNAVIGTGHSHQVLAYSDAVTYPGQLLKSDAQSSVILNEVTANTIIAPNVLRIEPATRVDFLDGTTLRNENFASTIPAITGWQINEVAGVAGWYALTIGAIQTDELHTRVFVSDEVRVDRGEEYWAKSYGIVAEAFTMPGALNGTVAVTFEDSPIMAGAVFSNGDWLMFQQVDTSGGGFSNVRVWGTVAGYIDNGDGTQTWTFTLRQGTTGLDFQAGALAVDFGQSGQGTIHLSAIDLSGAPYIRFGRWAGANPYTPANITTHVQIGNLTSLGTVSGSPTGTYGIFASGNGQTAELSDAGVILRDADFTQYDGANKVVSISAGNVLFGRNVASALDTGFTFTAATGDLIIGQPAGQKLVWDESAATLSFSGTLTVLPGSSGFGDFIDANMDNIEDGVDYERVSSTIIAGGLIQVQAGPSYGTKDSTLRGWNIGATEIVGQYDGVDQVVLNTAGNIVAGNGNVVLSRGGVDLRMADYDRFTMPTTENDRAVSWWPDPANRTGSPLARMYASESSVGPVPPYLVLEVDPGNADPDLSPWLMLWADSKSIWFGADTIVGFPGLDASRNPTTGIETLTFGTSDADQIVQSYVSIIPVVSSAVDLGSASRYWRKLYVDELIAGTITGGTQLTGQIWQFDSGDMYVRSTSSGNRVLYVVNPGAGTMSLNVEGSITVGGTVDGVDVSTLPGSISAVSASIATVQTNLNTHAANANAHHAQAHVLATTSGLGPDHTVNDLTAGFVLRATGAATARFMQLAHSDLSGIGANDHHAQSHVLATSSALGPDHTVSGLTAGHVLRATSATTARFMQLAHSDLSGIGPNDHHNRQHSITSTSDHTATGAQWQIVGLTATNTLGLLTPSTNGITEAILKSDSSGGLTLDNLTLQWRLRAPTLDTSGGMSMTIQPGDELRIDPGLNILRIMGDTLTRTDNYDPELTGWAISYAGAADFRRTFSNSMHVERLVADLEQALAGRQIVGKSVAKLAAVFTAPALGGTATLVVKDWQEAPGVAVFGVGGDYVVLTSYDRTAGGLDVFDCWGQVSGYTDNLDGTQTWTFTRSSGSNGGTMPAGTTLGIDALVFDYGTDGDGVYQINAIDNVYARVVTWTGHPATGQTTRALMGDLSVLGFGVVGEHGFYAGNGTALTSSYLRLSNNTFELHNLPLRLFNGSGTETVHIGGWNDVWFGTNPAARAIEWNGSALTIRGAVYITGGDAATQSYVTTNSARPDFSNATANWALGNAPGGSANNALNLNGTSGATVVSNANRAALGLNGSGYVSLPLRSSNIASTTAVTGLNLTNTHLGYHNGSAWTVWIQSNGSMYFGGASGARLEWNGSKLSGYNNLGAEQWYAGSTTGRIVAGGGAVWLDSTGINLNGDYAVYTNSSAIEWYISGNVSASLSNWSAGDDNYVRLRSAGTSAGRRDGSLWLEAESDSSVGLHQVRLELDTNHAVWPSATIYIRDPAIAGVNVYEAYLEYTTIRTRYGYLRVGPANAGYCHYTTDRPHHWFNASIMAGSNSITSYNADLSLQRATVTRLTLDASGAVTAGRHHASGGYFSTDLGNYSNLLGYAHVGYVGHSAYAGFAHRTVANATQYAMIQDGAGTTFLNSSGTTYIRINNATVAYVQSWGIQVENTINVGNMVYLLNSYTPVNPASGARVHAYWTGGNWELRVRFPNGNTVVVARDNLAGNH